MSEDGRHGRTPERFEANGESHTVYEWSRITGVRPQLIRKRIKVLGWSVEDAISPVRRYRPELRANARWLTHGGLRMTLSEWSRFLDIPVSKLSRRLGLGWNDSQVLGFEPSPQEIISERVRLREERERERKMKESNDE